MKYKKIYQETIDLWGKEVNVNQAIQEMAELTVELTNIPRKRTCPQRIALEMADVEIMLDLMKLLFKNKKLVEKKKTKQIEKLKRQIRLYKQEEK